jgi:hypothetical protein
MTAMKSSLVISQVKMKLVSTVLGTMSTSWIDVMGDKAAHYIYTYSCSWRVVLSQSSGLLFHSFTFLGWPCLEHIGYWV